MIFHSGSMIHQTPAHRLPRACHPGAMTTMVFLLLLCVLFLRPVHAVSFQVDSTADAVDATIGDGICATAAGKCSLRAAIQEVNVTPDKDNTITLPPGTYSLTQTGAGEDAATTGDLDMVNDLVLMGTGSGEVIISGRGDRVFDILAPATVTISGVIIENGDAHNGTGQPDVGGGIRNAGTLTLTSVAITSNMALDGGGLANVDSGSATLTNVTISGNLASRDGGGIANSSKNGSLSLLNVTVSTNSSGSQGHGIQNLGSGNLENTIVANGDVVNGDPANCSGKGFTSLGHNIDDSPSSICLLSPATGDLSVDPKLGPLRDNGGFTLTQALLPGSPAIDAGDDMGCPATDQRGQSRPQDGNGDGTAICDVGAYEVPGQATPTPTPTGTGVPTTTPTLTATPATPTATPGGPSIDLTTAMGNPGDQVTFAATLSTGGMDVVSTQNYITFDPVNAPIPASNQAPDCTAKLLNKITGFFFQPPGCDATTCSTVLAAIIDFPSLDAIPDGSTLYTCHVNISPDAAPGEYPLTITGVVLVSNIFGTPVPDAIGRNGKIVVVAPPTATPSPTSTATVAETVTSTPTTTPTATPTHVPCVGDCNDNGVVTIGEVVTLADIALDPAGAKTCPGSDGEATVDALITAADNLLNGCPR
jgi:CSLREA domain-containing protein